MRQKEAPTRAISESTVSSRAGSSRALNLQSRILRSGLMALIGAAVFTIPAYAAESASGNSRPSDASLSGCDDVPLFQNPTEFVGMQSGVPYYKSLRDAGLECRNSDGTVLNRPGTKSEAPSGTPVVDQKTSADNAPFFLRPGSVFPQGAS